MRQILTAGQVAADRDAWLKARLDGIGASEIGTIMRLDGAHGSPYALWCEKTGRTAGDRPTNYQMEFGTYCENFTAWRTAELRPDLHITDGGLYASDERPWQIATFDRLAHKDFVGCPNCAGLGWQSRPTVTVQLKNAAFRDWHKEGMPLAYRAQCIWEASIADASLALMPALNPATAEVEVWEIPIDATARADLELMLYAAEAFRDCVQRDTPPKLDGLPATTIALQQQYADLDPAKPARVPLHIARWWRHAAAAETAARLRKERWLNELRARAGDAGQWFVWDPEAGQEVRVATHSASPRAGYPVKPSPRVDRVSPAKGWKP